MLWLELRLEHGILSSVPLIALQSCTARRVKKLASVKYTHTSLGGY